MCPAHRWFSGPIFFIMIPFFCNCNHTVCFSNRRYNKKITMWFRHLCPRTITLSLIDFQPTFFTYLYVLNFYFSHGFWTFCTFKMNPPYVRWRLLNYYTTIYEHIVFSTFVRTCSLFRFVFILLRLLCPKFRKSS